MVVDIKDDEALDAGNKDDGDGDHNCDVNGLDAKSDGDGS